MNTEKRHITKVLLQVGRDVGAIGYKSLSVAMVRGTRIILRFLHVLKSCHSVQN
jgi:hypothetical protein